MTRIVAGTRRRSPAGRPGRGRHPTDHRPGPRGVVQLAGGAQPRGRRARAGPVRRLRRARAGGGQPRRGVGGAGGVRGAGGGRRPPQRRDPGPGPGHRGAGLGRALPGRQPGHPGRPGVRRTRRTRLGEDDSADGADGLLAPGRLAAGRQRRGRARHPRPRAAVAGPAAPRRCAPVRRDVALDRPARHRRRPAATARFAAVALLRSNGEHERRGTTLRLPGQLRPGHHRACRRHHPRQPPVRRGRRRGDHEPGQGRVVHPVDERRTCCRTASATCRGCGSSWSAAACWWTSAARSTPWPSSRGCAAARTTATSCRWR